MSRRASEQVLEEMQFLGAVKVRDVESAQRRIVETVQSLSEQGVIQIGEKEDTIEEYERTRKHYHRRTQSKA